MGQSFIKHLLRVSKHNFTKEKYFFSDRECSVYVYVHFSRGNKQKGQVVWFFFFFFAESCKCKSRHWSQYLLLPES